MVGPVLAASMAFMLPAATPPNAIAFSYGRLRVIDLVSTKILHSPESRDPAADKITQRDDGHFAALGFESRFREGEETQKTNCTGYLT